MGKDNNGPAFPTTTYFDEKPIGILDGMSLRDYFAAKAIQGALNYVSVDDWHNGEFTQAERYARSAYAIADAMLKEREK